MVLAAIGDGVYNFTLFLHILLMFVAFAPAFVHPILAGQVKQLGTSGTPVVGFMAANGRRIYAPALAIGGLLGFGLQGMSDGVYEFGQLWIWLSILLWIAINGILHAVLIPAERSVAAGDRSAQKKLDAAGGIATVLFLVVLALMVWKPGL